MSCTDAGALTGRGRTEELSDELGNKGDGATTLGDVSEHAAMSSVLCEDGSGGTVEVAYGEQAPAVESLAGTKGLRIGAKMRDKVLVTDALDGGWRR